MKKKLSFLKTHVVAVIVLVLAFGCKKGEIVDEQIQIAGAKSAVTSIPATLFDWETVDYMPTPSGSPLILVPWASGSNQMFVFDIAFDFKKQDGWELVYNTFSTQSLTSPYFFALYNKYRGLLRLYLYLPPGTPVASSYLTHGLSLSGSASSSMLNYIAQDKVEVGSNLNATTQIENFQLQSTGAWYAMQYEIAYDPEIVTTSQSNLNIVWNTQSVNITQIKIDGTSNGTVKTAVAEPSSAPLINLSGLPTATGKGAVSFAGLAALGNDPKTTGLGGNAYNAVSAALKSGLGGVVTGVLNAIFGGSSTTQAVNLTMRSTLELTGNLSNSSGLSSPTLAIPGSMNSQNAVGYIPAYDKVMGVFNLSAKPNVNYTRKVVRGSTPENSSVEFAFKVDESSFQAIFNPEVLSIAQIQNYLVEPIAVYEEGQDMGVWGYSGSKEAMGNRVIYGRLNSMTTEYGVTLPQGMAVRVSFDVVPNNGAPSTKIVKTFSCKNVIKTSL